MNKVIRNYILGWLLASVLMFLALVFVTGSWSLGLTLMVAWLLVVALAWKAID